MISATSLIAALHALSTGFADRALNIVATTDELEDGPLRSALYSAITDNERAVDQVRALGDALRDADCDQFLVNECYRAAFYLSDSWSTLAQNPLYAHFVANRAGPVLDKLDQADVDAFLDDIDDLLLPPGALPKAAS